MLEVELVSAAPYVDVGFLGKLLPIVRDDQHNPRKRYATACKPFVVLPSPLHKTEVPADLGHGKPDIGLAFHSFLLVDPDGNAVAIALGNVRRNGYRGLDINYGH